MILRSKHVGEILNVYYKQFYVCAVVGVLIKCLYEMHCATIKMYIVASCWTIIDTYYAMQGPMNIKHNDYIAPAPRIKVIIIII